MAAAAPDDQERGAGHGYDHGLLPQWRGARDRCRQFCGRGCLEARLDRGVEIDEPGWLALRISTKANNEFGRQLFGHTSPIYITVDGKSIRIKDEVEYLMKQMEDARKTIATQSFFATKEERERVLSIYTRGMETLRGPVASVR